MPPIQPSIETLRGFGAFTRVIARGIRYEKKPLKAYVSLSKSSHSLVRVGYAVIKGVRKSVLRNRLKRLMREAFQANKGDILRRLKSQTEIEIVFMYTSNGNVAPAMVRFSSINTALADLSSTIVLMQGK